MGWDGMGFGTMGFGILPFPLICIAMFMKLFDELILKSKKLLYAFCRSEDIIK
jgi:hypothetical protein